MPEGFPLIFFKPEGKYGWLSNFYPCKVLWDGKTYQTVEHAFQAAKSFDPDLQTDIRVLLKDQAAEAKRIGRQQVQLRADWERVKEDVMLMLLEQKFDPNVHKPMAWNLYRTGHRPLYEGSPHDRYWGCDPSNILEGRNRLGVLLMQVRDMIRPRVEIITPRRVGIDVGERRRQNLTTT